MIKPENIMNFEISYSIDQALEDSGSGKAASWNNGILALPAHEKLFVGGHCESISFLTSDSNHVLPKWVFEQNRAAIGDNLAICAIDAWSLKRT